MKKIINKIKCFFLGHRPQEYMIHYGKYKVDTRISCTRCWKVLKVFVEDIPIKADVGYTDLKGNPMEWTKADFDFMELLKASIEDKTL